MRKYVLAALLAGTLATPAFAQDFTGFRVEGLAGYDSLKSGDDADDGVDTGDDEGDESIDGVGFGLGLGYDFDLGNVVAGVEGEWMESTGEQDVDETLDGINFTSSVETGRDIYLGARIGFRAAPSTLIYAKGGYTNTSIEGAFDDATNRYEFDTNVDGYRLGAGVEQLFGPNMYGKLEYRYSNYSNLDFSDDFDFGDFTPEDFDTDIDLDRHQVMLGLGYRF
jgi:outer membrane immunogenic protein